MHTVSKLRKLKLDFKTLRKLTSIWKKKSIWIW